MEPTTTSSILGEVKDFLSSLKCEWPDLFQKKSVAVRPQAEAPVPVAVAVPISSADMVPAVDLDMPLKDVLPACDLVMLFRSRAEHFAPLLGVTFNKVRVKDQRSLWGSCTPDGNLNFSWRLALAPDSVLDYLVVHELSHRAQMNHSRRFWMVVERVCPAHRSHRRWLRRHGPALHRAVKPD